MNEHLLKAIHERQQNGKQTPFGYGILTADRYVKNVAEFAGKHHIAGKKHSFGDVLLKASQTLVYSNEDMEVLEKQMLSERQVDIEGIELPKNTLMVFKHVLTTPRKDRDGDVLRTDGAILDPKLPLLWQHVHTLPIGKMLAVAEHSSKRLTLISAIIDINELSHDAAVMVDNGMGRFSHGFRALEFTELKETEGDTTGPNGFDVKRFEIMEESIVSVPSNVDAEVSEVVISLVENGKLTSGIMKDYSKKLREAQPLMVAAGFTLKGLEDANKSGNRTEEEREGAEACSSEKAYGIDQERNQTEGTEKPQVKLVSCGTKAFDVELEHVEASKLEYEWASRWLNCQVKEMEVVSTFVPNFRRGTFLTGLKILTKDWEVRDIRNLTPYGTEEPPFHEVVELNSKLSDMFLVDGMEFVKTTSGDNICIKRNKGWGGISITTYVKRGSKTGNDLIDSVWEWSRENNFLKGEAFSLAGGFIKRNGTDWDDVILDPKNKNPLVRAVNTINEKGNKAINRGIISMGAPGTGKTLSARVVLNKANATFIWVAAKDFWKMGAIDGLCSAFELANELAPSVIVFEDIDNWMTDYAVDVVKTEMDGISKSEGVLTILTTNYPERMPDALIDRPGRFHDVLLFDLPSAKLRREMLAKWAGELNQKSMELMINKTAGYSGAHIYELVQYAKSLQVDDESLDISKALEKASEKIDEQRTLIDQSQLAGSNFRSRRSSLCQSAKSYFDRLLEKEKLDLKAPESEKAGRALSKQNLKMIVDSCDDIKEVISTEKNLSRASTSLCERACGRLEKVIAATNMDEEEGKDHVDCSKAMSIFLAEATQTQRAKMFSILQAIKEDEEAEEKMKQFSLLLS